MINAYIMWLENVKEKDHFEGSRRRCEDDDRTDLREVWSEGADWINLAQDMDQWRAVVKTVMNLRVP
jgi:hypothetical protein